MEKYTLSKPIDFDGEQITVLNMDLDGLSTIDLERAERQARMMLAKKETMHVPETNKKYLSCVAAKAAGVKLDLIKSLGGKDYTQVCLLVQNFLLDGDSDLEENWEDEEPQAQASTAMSSLAPSFPTIPEAPSTESRQE